jgi:adenylate cyclase
MKGRGGLTLVRLLLLATAAIALAVTATFYAVLESSRRSILERSNQLRDAEARRIDKRVSADLGVATAAVDEVAAAIHLGVLRIDDPAAVENLLFFELLAHSTISDVALTHAALLDWKPNGDARWAPDDRWQISVFRASGDPQSEIITRRISIDQGRFVTDTRRRARGAGLLDAPFQREWGAIDPTTHPTFETTVSQTIYGRSIWSDLSFSELDASLPTAERRVVVTVQKAVEDAPGHFAGVVRVGLLTNTIDDLPRMDTSESQRVFLSDLQGHLVARSAPADTVEPIGDDLRVVAPRLRPEVAAALNGLRLHGLPGGRPERSERLIVDGSPFLVTYRAIENSQGWVVGIVVPEGYYTRDLRALRDRFLFAMVAVSAIVFACGGVLVQWLRRSLGRVVAATGKMRDFDFSAASVDAPLREMADVMEGIERAKTSMRGLSKYVPVDLVRELYDSNREPELGGELREISLMFSDIEGFTGLSERLSPPRLAQVLGRYLEAMISGVRGSEGTVDKFIGDSVMAFWNAPRLRPDHAKRACRAVLACLRSTHDLYASPAWKGLKPLFTRFGLHRATVMVGHFGAPDRLSYTALGDGVNLASRLEGLCKQYGVAVLASEAIVDEARDEFAFRLIDRVAVKGKHESVRVYELLGPQAARTDAFERARAYEVALESYFAGDFRTASILFARQVDDPPSRVLAVRCQVLLANAPPDDWNGVYVASAK